MSVKQAVDSQFLESMEGKQSFLKRMFTVFISQEPKRVNELRQAIENKDVEKLRHLAHALKGGAATMGVTGVRDCCLRLENASKSQDLTEAEILIDKLESEIQDAYAFMFSFLAEH